MDPTQNIQGVEGDGPTQNIQDVEGDGLAGDLLVGGDAIARYLTFLGMPEGVDPYYLKCSGRWPIGKTGGNGGFLIASKQRLKRFVQRIAAGPKTAV